MTKTLLAGFEGINNSAKVLLDNLTSKPCFEKLYLKNDFNKCASQITEHIQKEEYGLIFAFGQKPVIKAIYIERIGYLDGKKFETTFNYSTLQKHLSDSGYRVKLSDNAGNYLCNHVYGVGLKHIKKLELRTRYVFVHIPLIENISNIDTLSSIFNEYLHRV